MNESLLKGVAAVQTLNSLKSDSECGGIRMYWKEMFYVTKYSTHFIYGVRHMVLVVVYQIAYCQVEVHQNNLYSILLNPECHW